MAIFCIDIAKPRLYLHTYHEPLPPDIPDNLILVHELDELLQQVGAHLLAVLLAPLLLDHIQHLTTLGPCTHTNHIFNYLYLHSHCACHRVASKSVEVKRLDKREVNCYYC